MQDLLNNIFNKVNSIEINQVKITSAFESQDKRIGVVENDIKPIVQNYKAQQTIMGWVKTVVPILVAISLTLGILAYSK